MHSPPVAVCLRTDNVPISYVHIANNCSHDLGYALQKQFWRLGITTEAASAVLNRLRQDGILYVTATHDRQNPASGAVVQKLGMVYRYYEEQWLPKDICVVCRMYQMDLFPHDSGV